MTRLLLNYLPALACLIVMAVICLPMLLGHRRGRGAAGHPSPAAAEEVAALREEVARLRAELTHSSDRREPEGAA